MNLNKHLEFLTPTDYAKAINIIGVGAVGSRVMEQLVRLGFTNFRIYDIDTVDDINIPNQLFLPKHIKMKKVDAMEQMMLEINPNVKIMKSPDTGYTNQPLSGAVFLCVDSINLRASIAKQNMYNPNIDVMFDGRMRLTDAQYYGTLWNNMESKNSFLGTMNFTDEEAEQATPVSVCGSSLSVAPTVLVLASVIVANFIKYVKKEKIAKMALIDPFAGYIDSM